MEKLTLHVKHFVVLLVLLRLLLLLPWLAGCLLSAVWLGYLQLLLWLMLLSTMTARLRVEQGRRFAVDELLLILLLLPISFWNISQLLCFCCIIFLFCSTCFCSFFTQTFCTTLAAAATKTTTGWTMQDVGGRGGGCQPTTTRDETFFSDVCTRKEIKMVMVVFRFSSRLICFKQLFYNN